MSRVVIAVSTAVAFLLVAAGASGSGSLWAQGPSPAFEVVSIKPNVSGDNQASFTVQPGGRLVAANLPLRVLISFAYQLQEYQVVEGPPWLDRERFDIAARPEGNIPATPATPGGPPTTVQLMTRSLLRDRFALAAHVETRDIPTYRLVKGTDSRTPSPLRASLTACVPASTPVPPGQQRCGFQLAPGSIRAVGRSMSQLAGALTQFVARPVFDDTGLAGAFDFDVTWTAGGLTAAGDAPPVDQVSVFTAIQEQLGLRLQGGRQAAPVLVVDSVSRPSPD